jgi:hypothetical protein
MNTFKIYLSVLLFILGLISCDTETGKFKNSQTSKTIYDTTTRFFPEKYEIVREDTVLDRVSGLSVVIEREVLMNQFVTFTYEMDSQQITKDNYRDYASTIMLYRHDTLICKQTFTKADFPQIGDKDFYTKAITHNTWFKSFDIATKTFKFFHVIAVPETDWAYTFTITLNENCEFKSELESID